MAKAIAPLTLEQLQDKLVLWQQRMNLLHWEIRIDLSEPATMDEDGDENEALAQVIPSDYYDRAVMRFGPGWEKWDPAAIGHAGHSIDYILCHELVHCWMRDLDRLVMDEPSGKIHRDAAELLCGVYHRGREHLVDHVARSLVDGWGSA